MRHLRLLIVLFLASGIRLHGEDPLMLGLKGAVNSLTPVPEDLERAACETASKTLSPYLRPVTDGFYFRSGNTWTEIKGLRVRTVTLGVVSEADRANGISDRVMVHYTGSMYRSKRGDQPWSQWNNQLPGTFPRVIRVERARGVWTGRSSLITLLAPCNDRPISIPRAVSTPTPTLKAKVPPLPPRRPATKPPARQANAPSSGREPAPSAVARNAFTTALVASLLKLGLPMIAIGVLLVLAKRRFQRSRRPRASSVPPRLPKSPPPFPSAPNSESEGPTDLIVRRETLLTPAEQRFLAVLEPLVTPRCRITSKVRLADLFDVLYAPGRQAAFNKIRSKHIDFVITDPDTSRILCAIELDDRTHQLPDRIDRDSFVNQLFESQGLPLLRVPCAQRYEPHSLLQSLSKLIGKPLAA